MHEKRTGSILVVDPQGRAVGILTRYDVIGRIALAEVPLDTPIGQVMVHPVHSLTATDTAHDAALLMSRHGVRHVPVTRDGVAIGLVSERDLFAHAAPVAQAGEHVDPRRARRRHAASSWRRTSGAWRAAC